MASAVNNDLPGKVYRLVGERKALAVVGGMVALLALLALVLFVWQKMSTPTGAGDYEGAIVDRWADNAGAAQGYQPVLRLLVESQDGKRFAVKVDPNVYESARVGMRIRSRSGQVVLVESSQPSVGQ